MNALESEEGGQLTTLVATQRGMTPTEIKIFMDTGELPDFSEPPVEFDDPTETGLTEAEARDFLAGFPLVAAGGFLATSEHHSDVHGNDALAFKFDPRQPRDSEGKWTDGSGGVSKISDVITRDVFDRISSYVTIAERSNGDRIYTDDKSMKLITTDDDGTRTRRDITYDDFVDITGDGDWTLGEGKALQRAITGDTSSAPSPPAPSTPIEPPKVSPRKKAPALTPLLKPVEVKTTQGDVGADDFPRVTHAQATQDFKRSWTPKQREAVLTYTDKYYEEINEYLRGVRAPKAGDKAFWDGQIKTLRGVMKPSSRPLTLLRGTRAEELGVASNADLAGLVGKTGVARGFSSTSLDKAFGKYSDGVLLHVQAPEGTPMVYLAPVSDAPDEHEMLLPPNTRYEVIEVREPESGLKQWNVVVRVIP